MSAPHDLESDEAAMSGHEAVALLPSSAREPVPVSGLEASEDDQIAAIRRGDVKVGKQLYSRLVRVIDATLTRVMGPDQPDHDDWVQVAFEEVVRSLYDGRFQKKCRLTSWAASIACHIGLNAIRSRRTERGIFDRRADLKDFELGATATDPERLLEARDELRRLRAALATLSPGRAQAVLLHDAFGYNLSEVAAMTGSTEAAVQSRLVRGRRDLEERLGLPKKANTKERLG